MAVSAADFAVWFFTFMTITATSYGCLILIIRRKATNLPPGPTGLPLVGSLFELGAAPHESLSRLPTKYGPLMTIRLGSLTTVVVSSAEMAEDVLRRHDKDLAGRVVSDTVKVFDHYKWAMILNQNGSTWRALRRACNTHLFTPRQLDAMSGLREQKVRALLAHVRTRCEQQEAVGVGECVFGTVFNLMSGTVFSQNTVELESEGASEFKNLVGDLTEVVGRPNLADFFPVLKLVDPQGLRSRMETLVARLYAFLDKIIQQRLATHEQLVKKSGDFLDVLLELSEDPQSRLTRRSVKTLLADLFVAGTDTTTSTVEWVVAELLKHPEKIAKAQSELRRVVGNDRLVEESDVPHLPYLQTVVKETLRLHPTAPLLIPHRADVTSTVGGFTIPRHAQVMVNVWSIGRDPAYGNDPTAFLPERFLGSDISYKGKHFQYLPFGSGRRMCPGLPLAERMVHLLVASLIHSFSWKLPRGIQPGQLDMESKMGITLQKATPLKAVRFDPLVKAS